MYIIQNNMESPMILQVPKVVEQTRIRKVRVGNEVAEEEVVETTASTGKTYTIDATENPRKPSTVEINNKDFKKISQTPVFKEYVAKNMLTWKEKK